MNAIRKGAIDFPTDRPTMRFEPFADDEQDSFLENLAADLTDVAYQVVLRHGVDDNWLELQLDLWGALTEALEKRSRVRPMKRAYLEMGAR
jgi:hypothetical protein